MFRNMSLKKALAIGIGVILGIVLIFVGFIMVQNVFTTAADVQPQDVIISEITQNSAKVTWTTGQETLSNIQYGTSPTTLTFSAPETEKTTNHSVSLTLLSKETTYYFSIAVGDEKFDNGGIPWTFTTKGDSDTATEGAGLLPTVEVTATPAATVAPTSATSACSFTDCEEIKANFGKGCTTQDYFKCVRKLTPTP